jgi:hypothetical protein
VSRLAWVAVLVLFVAAISPLCAPEAQQRDQTGPTQNYSAANNQFATRLIVNSAQAANNLQPKAAEKAQKDTGQKESPIEKAWRHWVRRFLTDLKITDVLVALFTGLLALYTARLWVATHSLQEAALSQARIMIAIESPVFSFAGFALEPADTGIVVSRRDGDKILAAPPIAAPRPIIFNHDIIEDRNYYPMVVVKNVGRSYMELRAFCIETIVGAGPPLQFQISPAPQYKSVGESSLVVEAEKDVRLFVPETIRFTEAETIDLREGKKLFYIYGFVRYFDQFTNEIGDVGFMRMWTRFGFIPFGLPNYNYHRRQKADRNVPLP